MPLRLPSHSRYKLSDVIVTPEGQETFGLMEQFDFLDPKNVRDDQKIRFQVDSRTARRPDRISTTVYGTPNLFWVVIMFNRPDDILRWPEPGTTILLPARSIVLPAL